MYTFLEDALLELSKKHVPDAKDFQWWPGMGGYGR